MYVGCAQIHLVRELQHFLRVHSLKIRFSKQVGARGPGPPRLRHRGRGRRRQPPAAGTLARCEDKQEDCIVRTLDIAKTTTGKQPEFYAEEAGAV